MSAKSSSENVCAVSVSDIFNPNKNLTEVCPEDITTESAHIAESDSMINTIMLLIDNTRGYARRKAFFLLGKMLADIWIYSPKTYDDVFGYVRSELIQRSLRDYVKNTVTLIEIDQLMLGMLANKIGDFTQEKRLAKFFENA